MARIAPPARRSPITPAPMATEPGASRAIGLACEPPSDPQTERAMIPAPAKATADASTAAATDRLRD
jgi:hypothetical protein